MGQGLGKDSPILLTLGKGNYEALISRHGQWVRWRTATKCPCVKGSSMQPDIHCTKCGGLGFTYGYQDTVIVSQTVMVKDNSGVIELDAEYTNQPLVKCYDNAGVEYPNAIKKGTFVLLNTQTVPVKGTYVTAVMAENILKTIKNVLLDSIGNNWYKVQGLRVSKPETEGLYHTAAGDIEEITGITDAVGNKFVATEIRQDRVYIPAITDVQTDEETGETTEIEISPDSQLIAESVSYIPPFTFVILNQNLSKSDEQVMQENNGDAVLTFPYGYDVATDDVITVLSGTYTQKNIIVKKDDEYDVIPAYFVDEIVKCVGENREYVSGTDFIVCGTNYIKWLCDDCPEEGEGYSITYKVFPTYKVVKSIPQIRTSENQRMPKKAVIKLYDTYGEARGVNKK